jgi:hypothetical protein
MKGPHEGVICEAFLPKFFVKCVKPSVVVEFYGSKHLSFSVLNPVNPILFIMVERKG